jgi:hypothetical protein
MNLCVRYVVHTRTVVSNLPLPKKFGPSGRRVILSPAFVRRYTTGILSVICTLHARSTRDLLRNEILSLESGLSVRQELP